MKSKPSFFILFIGPPIYHASISSTNHFIHINKTSVHLHRRTKSQGRIQSFPLTTIRLLINN